MKISLFDVVFRPIRTSRKLMRIMKQIELKPEFAKPKEPLKEMSEFVVLTTTVMMPAAVFNMMKPSLIATDVDGYSPMVFKRRKSQALSTYDVPYANAVCMLVAERLEE